MLKNQKIDHLIALGNTNIEKDRLIWKAYSEKGGLYDLLNSFTLAVSKPTINAMDYDEEDSTYIICITLYNTIYSQIKRKLEKLHQNLDKADQMGKQYVPVMQKLPTDKEQSLIQQETPRAERKLITYLKNLDHWFTRFRLYKKIRSAIVKHIEDTTTKLPSDQEMERVESYEEHELNKASYQMRYAGLLQTIIKIADEMGSDLPILRQENENALSDYVGKASAINEEIKTEVFGHEDWML